ncbi:hypothetical protein BD309DRAFT_964783 [Dichomitus squalens]|uniref:Uncharacterized protein n=1 Tax=Dichomitus squalens TaxID=114155 RepID=A0A4Q9Q9M8_9APHY|nr:hypothetical protein BD309DRAFT_964783 [Dichomitus squalens]TBU64323.1 hypothetical protein BD310DRAFT_392835 [Dichomitus squalens]
MSPLSGSRETPDRLLITLQCACLTLGARSHHEPTSKPTQYPTSDDRVRVASGMHGETLDIHCLHSVQAVCDAADAP